MDAKSIASSCFPGDRIEVKLRSGKVIEGFVCSVEFNDDFEDASDCVDIDSEDGMFSIDFSEIETLTPIEDDL